MQFDSVGMYIIIIIWVNLYCTWLVLSLGAGPVWLYF